MIRYGRYLVLLALGYLGVYLLLKEVGVRIESGILLGFFGFVAFPCGVLAVGSLHGLNMFLRKLHRPGFSLPPPLWFAIFFLATVIPTLLYLWQFPRWVEEAIERDLGVFATKIEASSGEKERFLAELSRFLHFYYEEVLYEKRGSPSTLEPLRDLFLELKEAVTAPALHDAQVRDLTARMVHVRSRSHTAPPPASDPAVK